MLLLKKLTRLLYVEMMIKECNQLIWLSMFILSCTYSLSMCIWNKKDLVSDKEEIKYCTIIK